jgi:hypothetical protein
LNKNRLKKYLLFNRNILIGFTGAFLTGAGTSQAITRFTSPVVNSLISLVVETSVFLAIFGILFYFDNKDEFVGEQGSKRVKWVLIKLASTLSVAEIEYNTCKTRYSLLASDSALSTICCFNDCKFYYYNRIPCGCGLDGISHSLI